MTLVDDNQEILREEIQQTVGPCTRFASVEVAGIVLDARAVSQFAEHFHIVSDPFLQALCLVELADLFKMLYLQGQIVLNLMDRSQGAFPGRHEKIGRINLVFIEGGDTGSRVRIDFLNAVNFVIPEHDAQDVIRISQEDIHRISLDPEIPAVQFGIVAGVETVHQLAEQDVAVHALAPSDFDHIIIKVGRISHTVDARYGRNHDDILPA